MNFATFVQTNGLKCSIDPDIVTSVASVIWKNENQTSIGSGEIDSKNRSFYFVVETHDEVMAALSEAREKNRARKSLDKLGLEKEE